MNTVTAHELQRLKGDNPNIPIVNTLSREDFRNKHIPDSFNIPVSSEDFADRVEETVSRKSDPVVVYCAGQECDASETAAKKLKNAGFKTVFDFEGGMQAWEDAGLPIA